MLTISSGHSASYLTDAVAAGRENYYTGAVAAGEPPGRWSGRGAERLGLAGLVDTQDMTALYERFIDPRDEAFADPDRWDEAATLGHTGRRYLTEDEIYAAALEREPGADPERRAALRVEAGKKARKNVAFVDATFSVQKSITVLHTAFEAQEVQARSAAESARTALDALASASGASGAASALRSGAVHQLVEQERAALAEAAAWAEHRQAVEDAIWAGNQAAIDYLSDKAGYSRVGHHGGAAGRWVDAHDWTVASFFQHDSRNHDPQLHIHNAILNRVEGSDGKWRTIDTKAIYRHRGAASAVGERVTEQHLTRALGVEFAMRPDGAAREIVGVDQAVMDLFSSRRRAITRKTATLVKAFEAKFGRSPNSLELDRLQRSATFATRNAKSHTGETVEQRLERWDGELRSEIRGGLAQLADQVLTRRGKQPTAGRFSERRVIETALADVQDTKAAWTAADLTRAISDALPDHLGRMRPAKVSKLLDRLTARGLQLAVPIDAARPGDQQLPDELRLDDGNSAYQSPGARLYATPTHIHTERTLAAATGGRDAFALPGGDADAYLTRMRQAGVTLGADQVAAVRGILTSGARVETLIGPAGTGKSFVIGTVAKIWTDAGESAQYRRMVVGLAASQIATDVLAREGLTARNITQWLAAQDRLAAGTASDEDHQWLLSDQDLIVVDESAMANTADLARIHAHCEQAKAKLLLVGDHRQLAAVGAGGAMELAAAAGPRHELTETRRFNAEWEGVASLRLRDHDQTVLAEYHKHGRLIDGGAVEQTEQAAARAWMADTLQGRHALLIVDTNEQAARLSAQIRTDLIRLGRVEERGAVRLGMQGTYASRGDLIEARLNGWQLAGYAGNPRGPINRERYRVLETRQDGSLVVRHITDNAHADAGGDVITLPAEYVAEHVALGYASTVHSAQGLTVDTSHVVATGSTGVEALYVGMTRGRDRNTAYVVTRAVAGNDAPTGATLQSMHRSPQSVLAGAVDTADPQLSALAQATQSQADAESVRTPAELFADATELATAGRTARWLDELAADGKLTEAQRVELAVEDGATTLTTLLRRAELAGHDPKQVLTAAIERRSLDDARQLTNVLHRRITETTSLDPVGDNYTDWIPDVDDPQWRAYLTTLAGEADQRRAQLGERAAEEAPQWAIEALGPVPEDDSARDAWKERAAAAAAHRELIGHQDPEDALGPAPKPGQAEAYASWRAAWRALGRPEADRAEAELSTGQLRVRVRAYEREKTWAPPYVANELAGTRQAAAKHREDAALRRAEAENPTPTDPAWWLEEQARNSDALAAALEARAAELDKADEARARWYAHTAETRAAADRASAELSARQSDDAADDELVTAEEWLAAQETAERSEDPHREIRAEHEFSDVEHERDRDQVHARTDQLDAHAASAAPARHASTAGHGDTDRRDDVREPEVAPRDVRQVAADEPARDDAAADAVRVPSADETADAVRRAQRALTELKQRQAVEDRRVADEATAERDSELAAWHADTTADAPMQPTSEVERAPDPARAADEGPVLEVSVHDEY